MAFGADITTIHVWKHKGDDWVARFYDLASQQHYSGIGSTAFDAVAWALDDFIARTVYGLPHTMARGYDALPGERFGERAALSGARIKYERPSAVDTRIETIGGQYVEAAGCFDTQIPKKEQPRLVTDGASKASSATRRAATKKKRK